MIHVHFIKIPKMTELIDKEYADGNWGGGRVLPLLISHITTSMFYLQPFPSLMHLKCLKILQSYSHAWLLCVLDHQVVDCLIEDLLLKTFPAPLSGKQVGTLGSYHISIISEAEAVSLVHLKVPFL